MQRKIQYLLLALGLALGFSGLVRAQETDFSSDWWNVDGSGAVSAAGPYVLAGISGQADTGVLGSNEYEITGSFWGADQAKLPLPASEELFLPLLAR